MRILKYGYSDGGFLSVRLTHYKKEYNRGTFLKNGIPHINFNGREIALKDIKEDKSVYTTYSGL